MGLWQTLGSIPGGHLVFEAFSGGAVSPYRLNQVKRETAQGVARAMGPTATREEKKIATEAATKELDTFLKKTERHPEDASLLNSPFLRDLPEQVKKGFKVFVLVAATGLTVYFGFQLFKIFRRKG